MKERENLRNRYYVRVCILRVECVISTHPGRSCLNDWNRNKMIWCQSKWLKSNVEVVLEEVKVYGGEDSKKSKKLCTHPVIQQSNNRTSFTL